MWGGKGEGRGLGGEKGEGLCGAAMHVVKLKGKTRGTEGDN